MLSGIFSMHFTMIPLGFHWNLQELLPDLLFKDVIFEKRSPRTNPVTDCSAEALVTSET